MGLPISVSDLSLIGADQSLRVSNDSPAPTYSVCTGLFTPQANPTDVVGLLPAGIPSTMVQLKRVVVSGVSTSGGCVPVRLVNTGPGGANTPTTVSTVDRDSYDGGSTCVVWIFPVNRSTVLTGAADTRPIVDEMELQFGVSGTSVGVPAVFDFSDGVKPLTLKNINSWLSVCFNGVALPAGAKLRVSMVWSEQQVVGVSMAGDSTTSNATPALLNRGANSGGIGKTGAMNQNASIHNHGSNGYRLHDFLNSTNGVTYPMASILTWMNDVGVICYGINDAREGGLGSTIAACTNRLTAMIDTAVHAYLNGGAANANYTSPKATKHVITSALWASNVVTLATEQPHGFASDESVKLEISGMSPNGFNGVYLCTFPTPSTIAYPLASSPGTVTATGRAAFTTVWTATMPPNPDMKIILWSPNPIATDDPSSNRWLSKTQNLALSGLWSGMILAQAAQALTDLLYAAYQPFVGDPRIYALLNKQDVLGRISLPAAQMGTMTDQLHPNPRGQTLTRRQLVPVLRSAIAEVRQLRF